MNIIKYSLALLSQANFIEKVGFIVFCLTANGFFPDLPVELATITSKLADYEKALDKSRKGDKSQTALARQIRADIQTMLKKNGIYVNLTADGDLVKLESSGFPTAKERKKKDKPAVSIVPTTNPGEVKVFINKVKGAVAYMVLIAVDEIPPPDKPSLWMRQKMTTKIYQLLEGIEP
ncbi:MAG: hypothetical protein WCL06_10445, partial [Bacteroidota bacterium]